MLGRGYENVDKFIHNIMYTLRKQNVRLSWLFSENQVEELKLGA